jgi:hypothetical protein
VEIMRETIRRVALCLLLSLFLVSLLSLIPLFMSQQESAAPVMGQEKSYQTVIDLVAQHDRLPLKRLDVQEKQLFFELDQQKLSDGQLYSQAMLLLKNLFLSVPTVQEIQLVVHNRHDEMIQINAKRQQLRQDPMMQNRRHWPAKQYLQKMFTWKRITDR